MVKAIVEISEEANIVLNIVKARENLSDKNKALNLVVTQYGKELLEPELRPEFLVKLIEAQSEKTIKIKDFASHYS